MSVLFRCSGCGKEYRVREEMAGRRATCRCGATTRVPSERMQEGQTDEEDEILEDWVATAFRTPPTDPSVEPEPPASTSSERQETVPPAPEGRPESRPPHQEPPAPWYRLVGVASVAYGSVAALVSLATVIFYPVDIFRWPAAVALPVAIAVGGVLILKRHPHGPACAGLSCVFLCFFSGWRVVLNTLGALTAGRLADVLLFLGFFVAVYSVPIGITVWCLRVETERQRREADEESTDD